MIRFLRSLYLRPRLYIALGVIVVCFCVSASVPVFFFASQCLLAAFAITVLLDILLLYQRRQGIYGTRVPPDRLSNGDENEIKIFLENHYPFAISLDVIDEIPHQFQRRDVLFYAQVPSGQERTVSYHLRPVERGEYSFGGVNVYAYTFLGLVSRRYIFDAQKTVAVYPSFLQMRKYELLAFSNRLSDYGLKKIRRIGHSMEFEKIREYVKGDDYRTVNWKATARKNLLMVNQFQDEKSQHVYCVVDKGRLMKMPFEKMTLLDYAINASLVISNIALKKGDKPGLVTFSQKVNALLPADSRGAQISKIQEALYREKTNFLDSNFELLSATILQKISQRSLILLYTNFESLQGMHRQLKYMRSLAANHLVVAIFFENTELRDFIEHPARDTEEIYQKAIAEKFAYEKRQIIKELKVHGIHSVLTPPEQLTVNTINKYLELKARDLI